MDLITTVDSFFLSFFTKISHRFCRLTGRTNFFLAKLAVCIMTMALMILVISFWFPLFGSKPSVDLVVISGFNLMFCLIDLNQCDSAESNALNNKRINVFGPFLISPITRFIGLVLLLWISAYVIPLSFFGRKPIFEEITMVYLLAWILFLYFVAVDPPAPGKSKIREWAESFSAGFRKLVPIKAKN